jgi:hypothetical protein
MADGARGHSLAVAREVLEHGFRQCVLELRAAVAHHGATGDAVLAGSHHRDAAASIEGEKI